MTTHACCYHLCPSEGAVYIGMNGNPATDWICAYHLNKWNTDRARFRSDGGGCAMEELGEPLEGEE